MVRLGDICVKASSSLKQSDLDGKSGEYPVFGAGGWIQNADFYEQDKPYVAVVKDGAGAGRVTYLPAFSSVIGTMQYILPKPGTDARYLAYALESLNLSRYSMGATIPHIYFKDYCAEKLPGYSEAEQQKISSVLAKVDGLLALRQRQLDKLDELVKARFVEMFGDPIIFEQDEHFPQLVEVCILKAGIFVKADDISKENSEGLYPCFGGNGCRGYVSDYTHDGEFPIIGRQGALCGNVQYACGKFHATEHAVVVTPRAPMDRYWLYYMLKLMNLNRYAKGAAQPGLAVQSLEKIHVQIPPLMKQKNFCSFVRQIDQSKLSIRRGLEKLAMLRAALMREYFAPDNS